MHLYEPRVDPRRTFLQVFAGRVRLEPLLVVYKVGLDVRPQVSVNN